MGQPLGGGPIENAVGIELLRRLEHAPALNRAPRAGKMSFADLEAWLEAVVKQAEEEREGAVHGR